MAKFRITGTDSWPLWPYLARTTLCFTNPGTRWRIAFDRLKGQLFHVPLDQREWKDMHLSLGPFRTESKMGFSR